MVFDLVFEDARGVSLSINDACRRCHSEIFDKLQNNVHSRSMATGNRFLPTCVDCHGLHNIKDINREGAVRICSKCHNAEFIAFSNSVHGSALMSEENTDVPICETCHGSHESIGIRDASLRLDSYEFCGKCHADPERMEPYGLSTAVLSTYLDDFHGRSADLFGQPGASKIINATCYDCHGIHNILAPDDPNSRVSTLNLQATCQECHPDAGPNFPSAWLSHKRPSLDELPGLFVTKVLLQGLVAVVVAFFLIFILFDMGRRFLASEPNKPSSHHEQGKK
jgi:predicted CXXCH cytochrome family protein